MKSKLLLASMAMAFVFIGSSSAQTQAPAACVPINSKIYIAEMPGGFHKLMASAIKEGHTKLIIVTERDKADFEIKEDAADESKSEGWDPAIFVNHRSENSIGISLVNMKTGLAVFSASFNFSSASQRDDIVRSAKRSFATRTARMLRDKVRSDAKTGCGL